MTDPRSPAPDGHEPVDPDIELASAHLDGETTPAERARLEADPALASLVAQLGTVVDAVRDVPPTPAGLADRQIAAALAELDEGSPASAGDGDVAAAARIGSPPWWRRVPAGAVAAMVLVIALVGVLGLLSVAGDDDDTADTATAALDQAEEEADDGAAGADDSAGADATTQASVFDAEPTSPDAATATYETVDDLTDALRAEFAGSSAADEDEEGARSGDEESAELAPPADPCAAVALLGLPADAVVLVQDAVVGDERVTAVVHRADDELRVVLVEQATCETRLDQSL